MYSRRIKSKLQIFCFFSYYTLISGNYTVSATIYHEINDETESATVIVENPIREYWVSTNSPIIYPQSTELVMTLNFSGDPLPEDVNITEPRYPSNVLCDIDYGDGILGNEITLLQLFHNVKVWF